MLAPPPMMITSTDVLTSTDHVRSFYASQSDPRGAMLRHEQQDRRGIGGENLLALIMVG
jgi:hypothetical protein